MVAGVENLRLCFHLPRQLVILHVAGCGFDSCGPLPFPQPRAPASPGAPVSLFYKSPIVPKSPEQGGTGQQLLDSRVEGIFLSLGCPLDLSSWRV